MLFIRSFQDDGSGGQRNFRVADLFFGSWWLATPTYEEELVEAISPVGPTIALGNPRDRLRPRGVSRIYVKSGGWESYLFHLMKKARLVIVLPGYGRAIRDELMWARTHLHPEKLLLYCPEELWQTFVRYEDDGQLRSFRVFLEMLTTWYLGVKMPRRELGLAFVWFSEGWLARPLWKGDERRRLDGSIVPELAYELTPLFQKFGVKPPPRYSAEMLLILFCAVSGGLLTYLLAPSILAVVRAWLVS